MFFSFSFFRERTSNGKKLHWLLFFYSFCVPVCILICTCLFFLFSVLNIHYH